MTVSTTVLTYSIRGRIVCKLSTLTNQTHAWNTRRSLSNVVGGTFIIKESSMKSSLYSRMNDAVYLYSLHGGTLWSSMCGHRLIHNLNVPHYQPDEVILSKSNTLMQDNIRNMFADIKESLGSVNEVHEISKYQFDGHGKAIRPLIIFRMSQAINAHLNNDFRISNSQQMVAKVAEMIHTASLFHDDVVDKAETRRGKPSVNFLYGPRKAIFAGDYVVSVAITNIAKIQNKEVSIAITQILYDIVDGEFMQLEDIEDDKERFSHYLKKTFNKTASVFAHSCKAAAILSGGDKTLQEAAFQYGSNIGIAFQLVDDLLDFVADSKKLGKPIVNDLKSGLATAPVLFACEEFSELGPMIMRRFKEPSDVEKAIEYVHSSKGLERTRSLVQQYCNEAVNSIISMKPSNEQRNLITIANKVISSMEQGTLTKGKLDDSN